MKQTNIFTARINSSTEVTRKFLSIHEQMQEGTALLMKKGMNGADIKLTNRGLVLRQVATGETVSRASITRLIGLTKMTVSNIVSELIDKRYLIETRTALSAGAGRNPMILDIGPDAPVVGGIYLSRDRIAWILTDLKLRVIGQESLPLKEETAESLQEKLLDAVEQLLAVQKRPILGLGVSAIGLLDAERGLLLNPKNFFGIQNFPIVRLLQDKTGLPVYLHNDMKAAALAERLYGLGREREDFIYLGITNGIGAGIISGGKLMRAGSNAVGELGHLCVEPTGPACVCGRRGCLEVYASIPPLLKKMEEACETTGITPQQFEELSADWRIDGILEEAALRLSSALTDMINLLDIDTVLIGHEGSFLPQRYLEMMEEEINLHIFAAGYQRVEVLPSSFGPRAPLFGSVCCVLNALFAGRIEEI